MCNAWAFVSLSALAVAAACLIVLSAASTRFQRRIEAAHAATWQWLGTWKFRAIDCEPQEAALPEFIWSGMYRSLEDPLLDRLAARIKIAVLLLTLGVGIVAFVGWYRPSNTVFACAPWRVAS